MSQSAFATVPFNHVPEMRQTQAGVWLWNGYLAPGDITLLTSRWKTGKSTLLTGLLRSLGNGEPFLGRDLRAGRALVVSEESFDHWARRLQIMPVGPHAELMTRPFRGRPTFDDWLALIDEACRRREQHGLDLFVVDPMAKFMPGAWESIPAHLMNVLEPLQRLTDKGVSVLLLHHPRKKPSEPGHAARGTGALLGFVDIALELDRYSRLRSDANCRKIIALSRNPRTPEQLVYDWDPATGKFTHVTDPAKTRFDQNWDQVLAILKLRRQAVTHKELLDDWPADQERPSASVLYEWLNRAYGEKRIRRHGNGTRTDPWRYRLENEDDQYYDRGELPPLRPLFGRAAG